MKQHKGYDFRVRPRIRSIASRVNCATQGSDSGPGVRPAASFTVTTKAFIAHARHHGAAALAKRSESVHEMVRVRLHAAASALAQPIPAGIRGPALAVKLGAGG